MSAPKWSRDEIALAVLAGLAMTALLLLPLLANAGWER